MLSFTGLDLVGGLLSGRVTRGITYLAVGGGDPAWDAAPPQAPDRTRTGLVHETYRVALVSGVDIRYAAGVIDVSIVLPPGVATGALREVGLFGGAATERPDSGVLVSHKPHDRVDKGPDQPLLRELRLGLPAGLLPGARDLVGGLLTEVPGLSGITFAALGTDGSAPLGPPLALLAEDYRVALGRADVRYVPDRHEVRADLRVPYDQGPASVAEAGLFGGAATAAAGTGALLQRQTFAAVDRRAPRSLTRHFVLSLVAAAPVTVPSCVAKSLEAARATLSAAGLLIGDVHLADGGGAAVGTVVGQSPAAGTSVPEGSVLTLTTAAAATVAVPDVRGLALATAEAALTMVGLAAGATPEAESDVKRGTVVAAQPSPATRVPTGSTVSLTVATPRVHAVPNLLGRTVPAALVVVHTAGFALAEAPYPVIESGSTAGSIVAQSPVAGTLTPVDHPVAVTLAAPFGVSVPSVLGLSLDAAAAALRAAAAAVLLGLQRPPDPPGLTLGATTERAAATGEVLGTVVEQTPAAGHRVQLYAAVQVVVAGAVHILVPDLRGLTLGPATAALSTSGFTLGAVAHRAVDSGVDQVVDQDPGPGLAWPAGGRIAVSIGIPVTVLVPALNGLDQAAATEAVTSRGLALGPVTAKATGPTANPGQVIGQNPAAGRLAPKGSTVAIEVAAGMPNLQGRTRDDALAAVQSLGLTAIVREQPSSAPAGTVVGQNPTPGAATTVGETVVIVVAVPPPVTVPDLRGVDFPTAQQRLTTLGLLLVAGGSVPDGSVSAGAVLSLAPPAGTVLPPGSTVTATLAVAPPVMVSVPNLVGQPLVQAQATAAATKLTVAVSLTRPAAGSPAGTVLDQAPSAGTVVQAGGSISVVVASLDTSVLVPDLRSLAQPDAQAVASRIGLGFAVSGSTLSTGPAGIVLSQDPVPGIRVQAGAAVNVVLSQAAIQVPNVVGDDIGSATSTLDALGLAVRSTPRLVLGGDGSVVSQLPPGGALAPLGAVVALVYLQERIIRPPGRIGDGVILRPFDNSQTTPVFDRTRLGGPPFPVQPQ